MSFTDVGIVYRKELRETLRDRRTLFVMVLFPLVVYPLLSILVAQVMAAKAAKQEARPSRVAILGTPEDTKEVAAAVRADGKRFELSTGTRADVEAARLDALLEFRRVEAGKPTKAEIVFDETRDESRKARDRLDDVMAKALPSGCAPRFSTADANVAPKDKVSGYVLSKILPIVVVLMVLLGAFYPAIDVTAGERERGTLETILSAPLARFDLMAGKVMAVATLAAVSGILNLASMSLTLAEGVRMVSGKEALVIPWSRAFATLLVIAPSAFLFASAMVAVGSIARSFKEAQNLLTPVYFLCFTPSIVAALGEYELSATAAFVPGVNVTLLAREITLGTVHAGPAALVLLATIGYGVVCLLLAARLYDSERLLYAGDSEVPLGLWIRRLVLGRPARAGAGAGPVASGAADAGAAGGTTAGQAIGLYGIAAVLLFFVFIPMQQRSLERGLLVEEWLGLLGLVVLFARASGRKLSDVLHVGRPTPRALFGAALIGVSAWLALSVLVQLFFRAPEELVEKLRRMVAPTDGSRTLAFNLFLVALTPAVCEEALFRGPILRGMASRFSPVGAAIVTGLLFGIFHVDPWRIPPTGLLGVLLSWVALTTGSIVPSMLVHVLNNAILATLAARGADRALGALSTPVQAGLFALSTVVLCLGMVLVRGTASAPPRPRSGPRPDAPAPGPRL